MASFSSQRNRCSSTVNFNVIRFLESLPEHEAFSPAPSHSEAPALPPPSPTFSSVEYLQDNEPTEAFPDYDDSQFVPAVPAFEEQPPVTYSAIIKQGRKRSSATAATLGPVVEEEEKPTTPPASFFELAAKLREPMPDNEDCTFTHAKLDQEVAAPRDTAQDDPRASIQNDSRTATQVSSDSTEDGSNSTEGDVTSAQKNGGALTQPTTAHSSVQLHLPQATGLPYAHTAPLARYFGNTFPSAEEIQENKHGYIRLLNFLHYREQGLGNSWANDPVKDPNFKAPIHLPDHRFNDLSDRPPVTEAERDAKRLDQIIRREVYDSLWCNLDLHLKWPNSTFDRSNPGNAILCKLAYSQRLSVATIDEVLPADQYPEANYFLKLATIDIAHPEVFQRRFTGSSTTMNPYSHQQGQHYQADANWMHHPQQGVHHPGQQQNHPGHMNHPHAQQGHYPRIAASSGSGSHQHGGHSGGSDHNLGNAVPEPQTDEQRRIMQWVAELLNGNSREQALMELSKKREQVPELALIIWHSFGVMTVLCQEILQVYPMLNPSQLTAAASNRVCNALALLQCVASHQETRQLFLNAHIPLFLYPFLNTTSKSRPFEYLRLTSLGVIGALVKNDSTEVINFLLTTEIIPLCLRIMETGSELSKTVAIFIVQKILLDDIGLGYICHTYERFYAVGMVLSNMVGQLVESQTVRLLKHVVRCFLRLSDNARAREALRQSLPEPLRDATFSQVLRDDAATKRCLAQLLINLSDNVGENVPANQTPPHM